MTTVTFFKRENGSIEGFRASGHAGFAAYGKDIVCAAISSLTQSTANGITDIVKADADVKCDADTGYLELMLKENRDIQKEHDAQILLKTLELALTELSQDKQYTGTIRIIIRERR
ncbi:MAG: ribosomal-processing cysteine protease Prp [Clostridia bacterium]|nr:ribosomal-processing cysteine protease Prp [Clostridia bacterium]